MYLHRVRVERAETVALKLVGFAKRIREEAFRSMAQARSKLRATQPVFSGSTRRHEGCVISESDPFVEDVKLADSYLERITRLYRPVLSKGSAPRGAGVAIPGITDGFTGKAPDMGAMITGVKPPVWGDRDATSE